MASASSDPGMAQPLTTQAALETLGPQWERLWSRDAAATPFQSPHWLLPWWKHIGRAGPSRLAAVAVRSRDAGELVALAPFYLYTHPATGVRHLFPIGMATSDYLDPLILPGWEDRALRCIASHLAETAEAWDLLELPCLRNGTAWRHLRVPRGWHHAFTAGEPNPALALGGAKGIRGHVPLPPRMARNLRASQARAARVGATAYPSADAPSIPAYLEALARLHGQRWRGRGLPGVLGDPAVLAWHREAAPALHARGMLRLYGLRLEDELIAVIYCLVDPAPAHARGHYSYIGGFEPAHGALSPGTLLLAHAIEQASAEGAAFYDFLRGAEAYKYRWGATDQPMWTLRLRHERGAPRPG